MRIHGGRISGIYDAVVSDVKFLIGIFLFCLVRQIKKLLVNREKQAPDVFGIFSEQLKRNFSDP
jgi:hypothetical protein